MMDREANPTTLTPSVQPADALASSSPSSTGTHSTPRTENSSSFAAVEDDIWGTPPPHNDDDDNNNNPTGIDLSFNHSHRSDIPSDIPRLRTTHTTAGYRDGIALAREAAVQAGFDEGYLLGAALGVRAGYLLELVRGVLAGLEGDDGGKAAGGRLRGRFEGMEGELRIERLLGDEFVDAEGVWTWDVRGNGVEDGDGGTPTVHQVANQHPVIRKWTVRVLEEIGIRRGQGMEVRAGAER